MNDGMYQAIIAELREISSNVRQLVDLMAAQQAQRDISTPPDEGIATGIHTRPARTKVKRYS